MLRAYRLLVLAQKARDDDCIKLAENITERATQLYDEVMLGRYLTRGLAGDIDLVEGRRWLERAVEQGITEAELDLGTVPAMPTPSRSSRRRARTT
jgi:TPR repeat protein